MALPLILAVILQLLCHDHYLGYELGNSDDMDAGRAEVGRRSIYMSPITVIFGGGAFLQILTVLDRLAKNLLSDTPLLQFIQFHLWIIEERQSQHLEYDDPYEGYISIYLLTQLCQDNAALPAAWRRAL